VHYDEIEPLIKPDEIEPLISADVALIEEDRAFARVCRRMNFF
jgi:hypothetical protein